MARSVTHRPVARSRSQNARRLIWARMGVGKPGSAALVLALLAMVLAACGGGSGDAEDKMPSISSGTEIDMPAQEDLAPNFSFTLYQGEDELGPDELDLEQLYGKPIVLNFWAGLCPPCRAEMPDFQAFYEAFKGRVTLVGIDVGQFTGLGNQQDAKDLLQQLGVTYPAGFTNDAGVIRKYKVLGMPTTVFINADGTMFKKWSGALNLEVLEKQSNAMLGQ